MSAAPATKVPAHITMSPERTSDWNVRCDSCKQLRRIPTRLLFIGDGGFELCQECVEELKTVIAAT
jgi:hypothetical protein